MTMKSAYLIIVLELCVEVANHGSILCVYSTLVQLLDLATPCRLGSKLSWLEDLLQE
jgi:hypothetical protein